MWFDCVLLQAQTKTEDLGNVWIITIDKSGSMKDGKSDSKFKDQCSYILSAIEKFRIDTFIDFNKDRFFVYHTGLFNQYKNKSIYSNVKIAGVLSSDSSFTDLFIHPYKNQYRLIKNFSQLKNIIATSLLRIPYVYKWSFVSQIRITALDKTLEYLSIWNLNDSYRNIYVLTITDDADANDQWKNDYRVIKSAKRARLEELNELQEKLIYNSLTGRGNGELEELFEDDRQGIHAYLYKYDSKQQKSDDKELVKDVISHLHVKHVGTNRIQIRLNEKEFSGYKAVYWQIDSIKVNGKIDSNHVPSKYFVGETEFNLSDDISDLKFNHIDIIGKIQVFYKDSILGFHYKDIPFSLQRKFVVSQAQHKSFVWLLFLMAMIVICCLLYYFVILPRKAIFILYLPDSRKLSVRHGHLCFYPSQIPLLLQTNYGHQHDYLINNNSNIIVDTIQDLKISDNKILVVSKVPLNLENPVFIADIHDRYMDCSSEMSDALKYDYKLTIQHYLVHRYSKQNARLSQFTRWLFDITNSLLPRYYYEINVSKAYSQYTIESSLRSHTLFLLDFQTASKHCDAIVERILQTYYSNRKYGRADAIISVSTNGEQKTSIDICLIEQKHNGVPSISNVNHIYHYSSTDKFSHEEFVDIINNLKKHLRYTLNIKKISVLDHVDGNISTSDIAHFNVSRPVYSRFILFIEANEKHQTQLVYSPFVPYCKFVSLRPTQHTGYLYDAITPKSDARKNQLWLLSNDIIRINTGTIQRLEFDSIEDSPTAIVLGQNKINIVNNNTYNNI